MLLEIRTESDKNGLVVVGFQTSLVPLHNRRSFGLLRQSFHFGRDFFYLQTQLAPLSNNPVKGEPFTNNRAYGRMSQLLITLLTLDFVRICLDKRTDFQYRLQFFFGTDNKLHKTEIQ